METCKFCEVPVKEFHTLHTWENVGLYMCESCEKRQQIQIHKYAIRRLKRWIKQRQQWINDMDTGKYGQMPNDVVLMGRNQFRKEISNCHKQIKHMIKCINHWESTDANH